MILKLKNKVNFVAGYKDVEFIYDSHRQTFLSTLYMRDLRNFSWKNPVSKWEVKFWKMDESLFTTRFGLRRVRFQPRSTYKDY